MRIPVAAATVVFTETPDAAAFTVQTQITKLAVLAGVTSDLLDPGCTRTHSCGVGPGLVVFVGEGLGLGFVVFVGDGVGLGLALWEPLLDGEGLGELLDGDGELEPGDPGLAEPLADGLGLLDEGLAVADFFAEAVALGERESGRAVLVSSVAPTVPAAAVVVAFVPAVLPGE